MKGEREKRKDGLSGRLSGKATRNREKDCRSQQMTVTTRGGQVHQLCVGTTKPARLGGKMDKDISGHQPRGETGERDGSGKGGMKESLRNDRGLKVKGARLSTMRGTKSVTASCRNEGGKKNK